jgi:hypothetical protein
MRTLITTHFISLDGVAEAPGGEPGYRHSGWTTDFEPDPRSTRARVRSRRRRPPS